jgi:predicted MPP superfamily phosphohydrolase
MKGQILTAKEKKNIRVFKFFLISFIFAAIAMFIALIGVSYLGNQNFKETFHSVSSLKVNNKIRILQISDLHDCTYGKNNEKLLDRVEKLNPDLILLTGDCLDSSSASTDAVVRFCGALAKIAPSFYIYGNNEVEMVYSYPLTQESIDKQFGFDNDSRDPQKLLEIQDSLTEKLQEAGVIVLKNSSASLTVGTTNIDVYGVLTSNPSSFWSYAGESFNNYLYTNEKHLKITAIHEPLVLEEFSPDSWGDLMLAGHTHGGVIRVPLLGPLYTQGNGLFPDRAGHYVYGRYEVQGRPLIVSAGLENKNIFRINNEPEIVIIDINKF